MPDAMPNPIVLYDGVCGLCNRAVQFLLKRDRHDRFRFAPLQSDFAANLLQRHGIDHTKLDTVYAVINHGAGDEKLFAKGDAFLLFAKVLGGVWNVARLGRVNPATDSQLALRFCRGQTVSSLWQG